MPARLRNVASLLLACFACAAAEARPALVTAASDGDLASVRARLEAGEGVDVRDIDGTTPLHWAVRGDHATVVDALLAAGADASARDRYGVTPLELAAVNGSRGVLAALLDAGADPNARLANGETALIAAARTGEPGAVALLLDRGADVDGRDASYSQTPLMIAAREGNAEAASRLLARGAAIDARTRIGPIPQFVPPCKGTGCGSEGVGINRGGLPDRGRRAAARGGMTPLLYAARDGRDEIARILIEAGADVGRAEANGIAPLLMAVLNDHGRVARQLLAAGADPNQDDFWGRTPLWAAVDYRNLDMNNREQDSPTGNGVDRGPLLELITALIETGADVDARTREVPPSRRWLYSLNDVSWVDFTGQTPFLRAALSGDVEAMRLLLEHGADPSIATLAGTTPLMAAAGINWVVAQTYTVSPEAQLEAVELCLALGNDVNATNSMGLSALLGAVNRGANDIVRYLVEQGADLDVVDAQGRTALRWAEGVFLAAVGAERKPETIALLEELARARR